MKKLLATISLLTAAGILSACGFFGNKGDAVVAVEETPSPKYKWSAKETALDSIAYELTPLCYEDDGYWACHYEKAGENIPQEIIDEAAINNEEIFNDGRYDIVKAKIYFVSFSGDIFCLENYEQVGEEPNTKGWKDFTSLSNLDGIAVAGDDLYTIEHTIASGNNKPDNKEEIDSKVNYNQFEIKYYICAHEEDSGLAKERNLIDCEIDINFDASGMHVVDGELCIISVQGKSNGVSLVSKDGKISKTIHFGGEIKRLIKLNDGSSAIVAINDNKLGVYKIDFEKKKYTLITSFDNLETKVYSSAGEFTFLYSDNLNIYGWNEGENFLVSWSGISVNGNKVATDIVARENGSLVLVTKDNVGDGKSVKLISLTSTAYSKSKERDVIYLATNDVDSNLQDLVAKYNGESLKCKIEICEDFTRADIINLKGLNYPLMVAEGKLEDLYPYIDKDNEINRTDFIPNILSALEHDGKMCSSFAGFSIDTVIGPASLVGDKCGWNYEQYYNALKNSGTEAFDLFATKDEIFKEAVLIDINSFIDWEDKSCNFNNEDFIKLLEFANTFPKNPKVENAASNDGKNPSTDLRIFHGDQLLLRTTLLDFSDLQKSGFEFNEQITYIGYPTASGTGNAITIASTENGSNFGISSTSSHKNEAWQFIRMFFLEDYQSDFYCFPININVFNQKFDEAKQFEYLYDEDGYVMVDEDSGKKLIRPLGTMYLSDYTAISYYPLSEDKANKVVDLVTSSVKIYDLNEDCYEIIAENTKKYFDGEITSSQAAEQVQEAMTQYIERWK